MSDIDLQAYLELADKATPGPWEVSKDAVHYVDVVNKQLSVANCLDYPITNSERRANAAFIALSRTAGPAAARRALAAEAEVRQLDSAFEGLCASFKTGIEMFEEQYKLYTKRIDKLQADLLASQQREAKLREALATVDECLEANCGYCANRENCDIDLAYKIAKEALPLTPAAASDRMTKLERVAEAAALLLNELPLRKHPGRGLLVKERLQALEVALAELDGEQV